MNKLNSLEGLNKYYCSDCNHFHIRKFKYKIDKFGKRIKTKDTPFFNHKEFAMKLSKSEIYNKQFKKSFKNYNIITHKKSYGSKKQ